MSILSDAPSLACRIVKELALNPRDIVDCCGRWKGRNLSIALCIKAAAEEAFQMGHPFLGTDHLMVAVLAQDSNLEHATGLQADRVRRVALKFARPH